MQVLLWRSDIYHIASISAAGAQSREKLRRGGEQEFVSRRNVCASARSPNATASLICVINSFWATGRHKLQCIAADIKLWMHRQHLINKIHLFGFVGNKTNGEYVIPVEHSFLVNILPAYCEDFLAAGILSLDKVIIKNGRSRRII